MLHTKITINNSLSIYLHTQRFWKNNPHLNIVATAQTTVTSCMLTTCLHQALQNLFWMRIPLMNITIILESRYTDC